MEATILRIKTKKEVEEMSLAAGYREIVNGSIYENSVFAICDYSDWEDYTIAGIGGAYVAHKFADEVDTLPEGYTEETDLDVRIGDKIILKDIECIPSELRGKKFSVTYTKFGLICIIDHIIAIPYSWVEECIPSIFTIGDIVTIDKGPSYDSRNYYYSSSLRDNYDYYFKDKEFTITRVSPTCQYVELKEGKNGNNRYKVSYAFIKDVIHQERSLSIINNIKIIEDYVKDGGFIFYISPSDKALVERLLYQMSDSFDMDYVYGASGCEYTCDNSNVKLLQDMIEDYSIITKIDDFSIEGFNYSDIDSFDIDNTKNRLFSSTDMREHIPSINDYFALDKRNLIYQFILKYYFKNIKYFKADTTIDCSHIKYLTIDNKVKYDFESNRIIYNKKSYVTRDFFKEFIKPENELFTTYRKSDVVKINKEYFVDKKIYGYNICVSAHKDSLFNVISSTRLTTIISNGYNNIEIPTYIIEETVDYEVIGDSIKKFMSDINTSDIRILGDTLFPEIVDDNEYVEYITPDRISRFNGDFWNTELRQKYGTKKRIRKVLPLMLPILTNDNIDMFLSLLSTNIEIEFLEGQEILEVFDSENLIMESTQGSSCMIDEDEDYFDIYVDNARVAVIRDNAGKILSRAICWTIEDNDGCEYDFMDRMYYSHDIFLVKMKAWARQNGYAILGENIYNTDEIEIEKEMYPITDFRIHLEVPSSEYETCPFIDSFPIGIGSYLYPRLNARAMQDTCGEYESLER